MIANDEPTPSARGRVAAFVACLVLVVFAVIAGLTGEWSVAFVDGVLGAVIAWNLTTPR